MKILLTGAGGLLGRAFITQASVQHQLIGIGRAKLNTDEPDQIRALAAAYQVDVLINCAADTDVEGAQRHPEYANAVNVVLPRLLAEGCARSGAMMVQISSTGCYGNWKTSPYVEDDPMRPTTVHHQTKALGEESVRDNADRWLIVRTGWLYGATASNQKNFIRDRLREARNTAVMFADESQKGNPTFASDVAMQIYHLLDSGCIGTFNCVAKGHATRRDYVEAIIRAAGLSIPVKAAPGGYFVRKAAVSPNEMAENRHLKQLGAEVMPEWREALMTYVKKLPPDMELRDA